MCCLKTKKWLAGSRAWKRRPERTSLRSHVDKHESPCLPLLFSAALALRVSAANRKLTVVLGESQE